MDRSEIYDKAPHVFVHVPRTGGSSAWTYLTDLCSTTHHILDIHYEAQTRLGHERYALQAMALFLGDVHRLTKPFLIHHHGVAPLNSLLPAAKYHTTLRHPADRLISYFHHVKEQQRLGIPTNEVDIGDMDIVEFYQHASWHRIEYCAWFGAMMWQDEGFYPREQLLDIIEPPSSIFTAIKGDPAFASTLADYVARRFSSVGFFDYFAPSTKLMARHVGVQTILPDLPHINASSKTQGLKIDSARLLPLCEMDIAFYDALRKTIGIWA